MGRRSSALALVGLLAVVLGLGCGGGRESADLLITADRLFDGSRTLEPGAVLVRDGEVVAVGSSLVAEGTRTVRLGDATILPGFIDLHVHQEANMLAGGVTTVRNLGIPLEDVRPAGRFGSLRVLRAGPLLSVPGGYPGVWWGPGVGLELESVRSAVAAVKLLARRGAAAIKISLEPGSGEWPMLSLPEVRAIVRTAHEAGLHVVAHATGGGVTRALAGRVDELAHVPCGAEDSELEALAKRQVPVVATLHVMQIARGGCAVVAERLVELGARLLYGSDVGNSGIPVGIDVTELRLLRDAGLAPEDVLAAATSRAGADLGLEPLGTLVEGAPADLVAVRGDARALRDDLASPLLVVAGGTIVSEAREAVSAGTRPFDALLSKAMPAVDAKPKPITVAVARPRRG